MSSIPWRLTGTENQQRIAHDAFHHIHFPIERLTQVPGNPELGWRDLNGSDDWWKSIGARAHGGIFHEEDGREDVPDKLEGEIDGRHAILGVIFPISGRIFLDIRLERNPVMAMHVLGMEFFHAVDFFLPMTDAQRDELMRLWGKGGTWWERHSYDQEYFFLGGEAWMYEGLKAYSDFDLGPNPFMHDVGVEKEDVWRILGFGRTDAPVAPPAPPPEPPPPPPAPEPTPEPPAPPAPPERAPFKHYLGGPDIYHEWGHRASRKTEGEPLWDTKGFRPCKVCKP